MTKGIVVLAQNNTTDNYVEQACLLAMSLKLHNTVPISIVTNDIVPDEYCHLFDQIIPQPHQIGKLKIDGSCIMLLHIEKQL